MAMLKCHDVSELVTAYLDGSLPPRTRLATRVHLWFCLSCRRYVAQFQETIRFLGVGVPPRPPENENEIMTLLGMEQDG